MWISKERNSFSLQLGYRTLVIILIDKQRDICFFADGNLFLYAMFEKEGFDGVNGSECFVAV